MHCLQEIRPSYDLSLIDNSLDIPFRQLTAMTESGVRQKVAHWPSPRVEDIMQWMRL